MKTLNAKIRFVCLLFTALLSGLAFGLTRLWWGGLVLAVMVTLWFFTRRYAWVPSLLLVIYIFLAGLGLLNGASPYLLAAGVTTALAAWELSAYRESPPGETLADYAGLFEKRRRVLLGISLGLGLLAAEAGLLLAFPIPFAGMVLIVLGTLFCLFRFYVLIKN